MWKSETESLVEDRRRRTSGSRPAPDLKEIERSSNQNMVGYVKMRRQ